MTEAGPFSRIGGHPAIDLVNTVSYRLDPTRLRDRLVSFEMLVTWAIQMGLVTDGEARRLTAPSRVDTHEAAAEWQAVLRLRENLHAVLTEAGACPTTVLEEYRATTAASHLTLGEDRSWRWVEVDPGLSLIRHRVARSAVDLLTGQDAALVRRCEDDSCGWVFVDRSPRHNRRWCVSADCGNRNRVRNHYRRRVEPRREDTQRSGN